VRFPGAGGAVATAFLHQPYTRHPLKMPQAQKLASEHGYRLIGMIRGPREGDDLMVVRCNACGRQSVERPCDVEFGCTCKGNGLGDRNPYPADKALPAE